MIGNKTLASVLGAGIALSPSIAQPSNGETKLGMIFGVSHFDYGNTFSFEHSLHPNDGYLGPGNQGKTTLDSATSMNFGLEVRKNFGWFEPYGSASLLYFPNSGEDRKWANRGFLKVYSQPSPIGGQFELGARIYPFKNSGLFIGGGVEWSLVGVNHGWERFAEDQKEKTEHKTLFGAGATAGYVFERNDDFELAFEAGYFKGIGNEVNLLGFKLTGRF